MKLGTFSSKLKKNLQFLGISFKELINSNSTGPGIPAVANGINTLFIRYWWYEMDKIPNCEDS